MEIVFAGFGGQGVLTSGLVLANIAMESGYKTLWSPAYGGAMRGGKAFSLVKFDKTKVMAPTITTPDVVVAMNKPSLDFAKTMTADGILIINSDTIEDEAEIDTKAKVIKVPINRLALDSCNNLQAANIVSVGVVTNALGIFDKEAAIELMKAFFVNKNKAKFNAGNEAAFLAGYDYE